MRRYWTLAAVVAASILGLFLVVAALRVPLLSDPGEWMDGGGPVAAAAGVGLLWADVLLPVPSSMVMLAHGALFGVWAGAALSLVGSVGAALLSFAVGRAGGPLVARLVTPAEQARADRLLARWGVLAIVVTRPVPILAETTAILAGASPLPWAHVLGAAAAGAVVPAFLYALAGASATDFASGAVVFAGVLLVTGCLWWAGRRLQARPVASAGERG